MDAELKAKWVAALRSGEFEQGRSLLFSNDRYCCLGVLACVVNGAKGAEGAYGCDYQHGGYEIAHSNFPDHKTHLEDMNDVGKSFPEIADYIEANL